MLRWNRYRDGEKTFQTMGSMQFRHIKKVMRFFVRHHLPAKSRSLRFYSISLMCWHEYFDMCWDEDRNDNKLTLHEWGNITSKCGRGRDFTASWKSTPLHVLLAYHSRDVRIAVTWPCKKSENRTQHCHKPLSFILELCRPVIWRPLSSLAVVVRLPLV
jgi:hypothetical protein